MVKTKLIAEIGTNHNGSPALALDLVKAAIAAKADIIKMSLIKADLIAQKSNPYWERAASLELPDSVYEEILSLVAEDGLMFAIAPFGADLVEKAVGFGADYIKVASGEITNNPLLVEVANCGIPAIISTGMADDREVQHAVEVVMPDVLMHCVSLYPTPEAQAGLLRISNFRETYPDIAIGYSDHTRSTNGIAAALGARALGATFIERHFMLHGFGCIDAWVSLNEVQFEDLAERIMDLDVALTDYDGSDNINRQKLRRGPSGLRGDWGQ